jgi:hypothetical protein
MLSFLGQEEKGVLRGSDVWEADDRDVRNPHTRLRTEEANTGPSVLCEFCWDRSGLFQDFFLELFEELVFLHPVRAKAPVEVGAKAFKEPLPDRFPSPEHDIF